MGHSVRSSEHLTCMGGPEISLTFDLVPGSFCIPSLVIQWMELEPPLGRLTSLLMNYYIFFHLPNTNFSDSAIPGPHNLWRTFWRSSKGLEHCRKSAVRMWSTEWARATEQRWSSLKPKVICTCAALSRWRPLWLVGSDRSSQGWNKRLCGWAQLSSGHQQHWQPPLWCLKQLAEQTLQWTWKFNGLFFL